jgi:Tfp pilus assembly protein PilN
MTVQATVYTVVNVSQSVLSMQGMTLQPQGQSTTQVLTAEMLGHYNAGRLYISPAPSTISSVDDLNTALAAYALAADVTAGLALKANASTMTTALAGKVDTSAIGAANGVAPLNASSKVPAANLP